MIRKGAKKQMSDYILAGFLTLVVLWLLWLVWGIAQKEEIARHAALDTKAQLGLLDERRVALENNITELNTERGKEATLRATYGVARPGEQVIIVVPGKEASTTQELPWWKKAFGWLGVK